MKRPADGNGGRDDGFARSIAQRIDLDAIQRLLKRERFTPGETVALAWANLAATQSSTRGLTDEEYDLLTWLHAHVDHGPTGLTAYQATRALQFIQRAFDGDADARDRMLRYARELKRANAN